MAIEHRITSTDTLRTLAQFYLGNSNLWQSIADFNGLSYPYIVESEEDRRNHVHGNGYVRMTRTNFRTARTVRKGWQLYTEPDAFSGQFKVFEVTRDVVFPSGVNEAFVHLRATIRGVYGNIAMDTKLTPAKGFIEEGFQLDGCITVERFVGGQDTKLLLIGEYIYIPNETNEISFTDRERVITFVGEEDIALDAEGELYVDGFGDIASVQGADNIAQAVNHRLMTERGSLKSHPTYGSNLHYLIGQMQTPYYMKLIELDIYETLSYEDRIRGVEIESIRTHGGIIYVDISFSLQNARQVRRSFVLDYRSFIPLLDMN